MRYTPHALIALGVALLLYAIWSVSAAAMADGMQASERRAARLLIQNMPEEDIRRVFGVPPQVQNTGDWLQHSIGQDFSKPVARYISANVFLLGVLGVTHAAWGACELASRRRAAIVQAPP